ncbi:TRAFs-binding domain-containing protein [Vibrio ostreicida]|uniref:TRAFs-binding domain-containing protein n=1 Tax=Vibrio ostreicida TaxID=526588 RepID=UPI003B58FD71
MNSTFSKSKICFVIMGFGKKTDPDLGITYDLDKTYKNIIRPAVENAGFECVRADEIKDSGLIDKSMYALLMQAELVVADITTFNPNAIYELGIRHGVRPHSTIILKEKNGKIPFDLDHTRMCMYSHLGEDIGVDEAERCKTYLTDLIHKVTEQEQIDSPLYEFINEISPPILPESEYVKLIDDLADREKVLFALVEKAKSEMKKENFEQASKLWEKISDKAPSEPYFIQQWALCKYKSNTEDVANLTDSLSIIEKLITDDQNTNDPETLGIRGAIYKNIWWLTKDLSILERAIECYGKCFKITNNYYNGENYSFCLDEKSKNIEDADEIIYCKFEAKKTRKQIIKDLIDLVELGDFENRLDKKWIYASLSNCYLAVGLEDDATKYETDFLSQKPSEWEIKTFEKSKNIIMNI